MADIPPPPGANRAVNTEPKPSGAVRYFRRGTFTPEAGSRNAVENSLQREVGRKSEYHKFDEELDRDYTTFLRNHVNALIRATERNPQLFEAVRNLPDGEIYTLLTSIKKDFTTGIELVDQNKNVRREVDEKKIKAFLDDSRGWEMTTKLLEYKTAMMEFALHINYYAHPAARRMDAVDPRTGLPMNVDRGAGNVGIEDHVGRFMSRRVMDVAGRRRPNMQNIHIAGGYFGIPAVNFNLADLQMWHVRVGSTLASIGLGGIGFIAGGPIGAAAGAASPLAFEGIMRTMRGGLRLNKEQCVEGFRAIWGNNPNAPNQANALYLREVLEIDLNDFRYDAGTNTVEKIGDSGLSRPLEHIDKEIRENLRTREHFYTKALDIPQDEYDASIFQTITRYAHNRGAEPLDTHMQREFVRQWNPDQNGIRDQWGQTPNNPYFGRIDVRPALGLAPGAPIPPGVVFPPVPPGTAGFNPASLDQIGNIRRGISALRVIMVNEMQDYLHEELQKGKVTDSKAGSLDILKNKKTDREGEGDTQGRIKKERAADLTKRKETLTGVKESLATEKNGLNAYNTAVDALKKARQDAQDKYGVSDIAGIDKAIAKRHKSLTAMTPGSYPKRSDDLEKARGAAVDLIEGAIPLTYTGKARESEAYLRSKPTNERYDKLQKKLKEDVADKLEKEKAELQTLRNTIETNKKNLEERQTSVIQARTQLESLRTENGSLIDPATGIDAQLALITVSPMAPVTQLGNNELATLPVDEIFNRIVRANRAGAEHVPPVAIGWSENDLKRPEIRQRVIKAIVEARAQATENLDTTRPTRLADYDSATAVPTVAVPAAWNISENLLRSYSPSELIAEQTRRQAANPVLAVLAIFSSNQATNAILEAQNRLQVRVDAMTKPTEEIDEQLKQINHDIENIDLKGEIAQIDAAATVVKRKDYVYEQAASIRINRNRFVDTAVISATDVEYTTQERAVATRPKGYFEMLDLMFGYKNKAERGKYFEEIQKVLPPRKLAEELHNSFGYPAGVVNADENVYLTNVLSRMQTDMTARRMSTVRLQRAMRAVVHRLEDEALALA